MDEWAKNVQFESERKGKKVYYRKGRIGRRMGKSEERTGSGRRLARNGVLGGEQLLRSKANGCKKM